MAEFVTWLVAFVRWYWYEVAALLALGYIAAMLTAVLWWCWRARV